MNGNHILERQLIEQRLQRIKLERKKLVESFNLKESRFKNQELKNLEYKEWDLNQYLLKEKEKLNKKILREEEKFKQTKVVKEYIFKEEKVKVKQERSLNVSMDIGKVYEEQLLRHNHLSTEIGKLYEEQFLLNIQIIESIREHKNIMSHSNPKTQVIFQGNDFSRLENNITILDEFLANKENFHINYENFSQPLWQSGYFFRKSKTLQDTKYLTQVYSVRYNVICRCFPQLKERIQVNLNSNDAVVLKIYEPSVFQDYYIRHTDHEFVEAPLIQEGLEQFQDKLLNQFATEIECYECITRYNNGNPQRKINIPQLYDYGIIHFKIKNKYICGGFFMLLSYIRNDFGSISPQSINHGCEQLKILNHKLKIYHNDIARRNYRIYNGKFYFIDFGNSSIELSQFVNDYDIHRLKLSADNILKYVEYIQRIKAEYKIEKKIEKIHDEYN